MKSATRYSIVCGCGSRNPMYRWRSALSGHAHACMLRGDRWRKGAVRDPHSGAVSFAYAAGVQLGARCRVPAVLLVHLQLGARCRVPAVLLVHTAGHGQERQGGRARGRVGGEGSEGSNGGKAQERQGVWDQGRGRGQGTSSSIISSSPIGQPYRAERGGFASRGALLVEPDLAPHPAVPIRLCWYRWMWSQIRFYLHTHACYGCNRQACTCIFHETEGGAVLEMTCASYGSDRI
jgi:hypothetical protein